MMKDVRIPYDKNVLIGLDTMDDAGVYQISDDIALIQTVDFFTPIVDDPYTFGRIAACNSLSDIYAMGGKPLTALNIVCFPVKKFSLDILSEILKGGMDVLKRAGVQLLGGHSVEDNEMKYGLSVTGVIHPDKVLRNVGIKSGDSLILTKPLGTGIIGTAIKAGMADDDMNIMFIESMTTLNDVAADVIQNYEVHACTDVTGFGLIGHLSEILSDEKLEIVIDSNELPVLPGAAEKAAMGLIPGGMYNNRSFIGDKCVVEKTVEPELSDIAFDPQTSGGLVIAVENKYANDLLAELKAHGLNHSRIIGSVRDAEKPGIIVK